MTEKSQLRDDDLLRLMRAGDEEAFTLLYRRRQGGLYRFALRMSGSPNIAEEVTQETFMVLLRHSEQFNPARGSVSSFLFGIARNYLLRSFDCEGKYLHLADEDAASGSAPGNGRGTSPRNLLDDLTRGETIARVRQAVLALPASYREAVVLCDLEELSYQQAAEALGCAVGTVRSRLHRGRSLLLEKLRAAPHGKRKSAAATATRSKGFQ